MTPSTARPASSTPVLLDGRLVPEGQAAVSAFDRGLMYGESVFETLKVVEGEPCLWLGHRDRLAAGCARLGIPVDVAAVERGVRLLLAEHPVELGALRVQVTGGVQPGGGRGLLAEEAGRRPRVIARVDESPPVPNETYIGARVVTTNRLCRPEPAVKSGSYLASVAAKGLAQAADAFECLFTRVMADGREELLEGSFTSLLSYRGDVLLRIAGDGMLPGVTAGTVADAAASRGVRTAEGPLTLAEAHQAGLLLTSSLLGVCPVVSLDGRDLPDLRSQGEELRSWLAEREAASRQDWRGGVS